MAISIHVRCPPKPRRGRLFGLGAQRPAHILARLAKVAEAHASAAGFGDVFDIAEAEPEAPGARNVDVSLYPQAEPVRVRIDADGEVVVRAKTSTAGPGYHAYVVEFIDALGTALKRTAQWAAGDDTLVPPDPTGYGETRDVTALQDAMLEQLTHIARAVCDRLSEADLVSLKVHMPIDYAAEGHPGILTPIGPFSEAWFRALAGTKDAAELQEAARAFFLWWQLGETAAHWRALALASMWTDLSWTAPIHANEAPLYARVARYIARARALDLAIDLPEAAVLDLERLIAAGPDAAPAPPSIKHGVGYRRGQFRRTLTGPWSALLPGWFQEGFERENTIALFTGGSIEVRGSSITATYRDGAPPPPWRPMVEPQWQRSTGGFQAVGESEETTRDDGLPARLLTVQACAAIADKRHELVLTVLYGDDPRQEAVARAIFDSLSFAPPDEDEDGQGVQAQPHRVSSD